MAGVAGVSRDSDHPPVLLSEGYHKGRLSLQRIAQLVCSSPAEIFRLPGKGHVRIGEDADLTLVDVDLERTVRAAISAPIPTTASTMAGR